MTFLFNCKLHQSPVVVWIWGIPCTLLWGYKRHSSWLGVYISTCHMVCPRRSGSTCLEQPLTSDEVQICIQRLEGYLSGQATDSHDLRTKELSAKSILASSEACHMLHIHSNKYWMGLWFVFTLNSRRLFYISPYCFASIKCSCLGLYVQMF